MFKKFKEQIRAEITETTRIEISKIIGKKIEEIKGRVSQLVKDALAWSLGNAYQLSKPDCYPWDDRSYLKDTLISAVERIMVNKIREAVQQEVNGERFIDEIVNRINRKQVQKS